jgi:hypothetical protein
MRAKGLRGKIQGGGIEILKIPILAEAEHYLNENIYS